MISWMDKAFLWMLTKTSTLAMFSMPAKKATAFSNKAPTMIFSTAMSGNIKIIFDMGKVDACFLMEIFMMETGKLINLMVKES
jgi:hypothetical protein